MSISHVPSDTAVYLPPMISMSGKVPDWHLLAKTNSVTDEHSCSGQSSSHSAASPSHGILVLAV